MTIQEIAELAVECGFDHAAPLDVTKMTFRQEVRDMCAADKCHMYNRSWGCPPAIGPLEEIREKAKAYQRGILVQCTCEMEDSFDMEAIEENGIRQKEAFVKLTDALRPEYPDMLPMGTGGCTMCEKCTYPDAPCRFPGRLMPSMEAYGLVVSDECKKNGLPYYYGPNTMTFTACVMID